MKKLMLTLMLAGCQNDADRCLQLIKQSCERDPNPPVCAAQVRRLMEDFGFSDRRCIEVAQDVIKEQENTK